MIDRSTNISAALRSRQRGFLLNPYRFGAGGATDPYRSSVVMHLSFDGADGGTTFTDSSSLAHTLTRTNNVQLSTTQIKFGSASGRFGTTGTTDYLTFTPGWTWNQVFTWEAFVYPTSNANNKKLVSMGNGTLSVSINATTNYVNISRPNVVSIVDSTVAVTLNAWNHIAVSQDATYLYLFINGTLNRQISKVTFSTPGSSQIGSETGQSQYRMVGYLDEYRITSGVCRYTASFTVPASAFPTI